MKKIISLFILSFLTCQTTFGFENHRYPVTPILYYSALPAPVHSEIAAELSMRNSGAFTYAFSQNAQQGIGLTAPYFHVFSARQRYFSFHEEPLDISDTLKQLNNKYPNGNYDRRLFMFGSAISLANFGLATQSFNASIGFSYMSRSLTPNFNAPEIRESDLIPSIAVRYNNLYTSLLVSTDYYITGKVGYVGNGFQAGSKLTVYTDVDGSFELSIAGEKSFFNAFGIKAQLRNKWQRKEIYQQTFSVSAQYRLRPYNPKTDPSWLKVLIDPLQIEGLPQGLRESNFARFIYNIELSVGVYSDIETKDTFTNMTISKHF